MKDKNKIQTQSAIENFENDVPDKFRLMAETIEDVFWMATPDLTRMIYVSPAFERIWGLTCDSLYASPRLFMDAVHAEDRDHLISTIEHSQRNMSEWTCVYRIVRPDGSVRWIEDRGFPVFDKDGIHCVTTGVAKDITAQKQSEKELRDSEAQFRAMFSLASIGMAQADPRTGRWMRVNRRMCEITGYSPEEMLSMRVQELTHPNDRKRDWELFEKVVRGERNEYRLEKRYIRKDGQVVWVNVNMTVIRDADGQPLRTMAAIEDISERKDAETVLREQKELYQAIVDQASEGIVLIDLETLGFVEFNEATCRGLGYSREEFARLSLMDVQGVMTRDELTRRVQAYVKAGKGFHESRQRMKDGSHRDVLVSSQWIQLRGRDYFLSIWRDITEQKKGEKERKDLEDRLARAEKMEALGMLAGGVAHDLNNVLGILVGYSELMADEIGPSSPLKPHVEYIRQGGERASVIVQDLLTLARRGVQTNEIVDINSVLDEALDSPEFEKMVSFHPNVNVEIVRAKLLHIKGSPVHLRKTILNLIANAAEAMPSGGTVTISTGNKYLDKPLPGYDVILEGDYVVVSVTDTGEGITPADMKRIFEPFYTKKVMGRSGTGLGLAVVWGTVKDHNGYLSLESELGEGSTFTLYFPVTREELSDRNAAIPVSAYRGKGESVLVVDDVPGQRELAARMLTKLNYRAIPIESGEAAVKYVQDHETDLVVLDMIMDPGMDGLDTYRKILMLHPGQKAIIVSGFSESERVRQAQALGAGAYVRKPYISETLGIAVRKELEKTGR